MNTKKIYLTFALVFLIGIVSASSPTLGTFRVGSNIELKQTCTINGTFCDLCNITSVDYPNGTIIVNDVEMTKRVGDFNYSLVASNTMIIGTYRVNGYCDYGSDVRKTWVYTFEVTPSGFTGTLGFFILILVLSAGLIILGFIIKDAPVTILGSFGLTFLGLYILFNGFADIRDPIYTWAIGIIILMVASYIGIKSAYELIADSEY